MAELADALGSGPSGRKVVEVRVLLSAPTTTFALGSKPVSLILIILNSYARANSYAPAVSLCVLRLCAMPYWRIL